MCRLVEAVLFGHGTDRRGIGRLEGAKSLWRRDGVAVFARRPWREFVVEAGLTPAQARRLSAAFELGRVVERSDPQGDVPLLRRPCAVARLMAPELRGLDCETFHVLVLDVRHRLKSKVEVSRGTLNSAPVHPREVFGPALRLAGAAVIVVHNHPSGDPEPSGPDLEVTRRLVEVGRMVGIPLLDHLIWAHGAWVSLRERPDWPISRPVAHP